MKIRMTTSSLLYRDESQEFERWHWTLKERKEICMRLALVQMPNYGSKDENLYKSLQEQ